MKTLAISLIALALIFFVAPGLLAASADEAPAAPLAPEEGDGEEGGSKFDDPEEKEPKFPEEPVPATFTFKDYRLEMETEDGRFWKELPISAENKEAGVVFVHRMKLPKSNDIFDVQISVQGWEHGGKFDFDGKEKVGSSNYKAIAEVFYERDLKEWKDVKDEEKPRSRRLSREINKAYRYALTGNPGGLPLRKEMWLFKFKDKTYGMQVLYSTTAAKNEEMVDQVEDMLKTLREWREKR